MASLTSKPSLSIRFKSPIQVTVREQDQYANIINSASVPKFDSPNASAPAASDGLNSRILYADQDFRFLWDVFIFILLVYVASVSVYVYSFIGSLQISNPFFWIERFLDVCFLTDIVLNFFTTYTPYEQRHLTRPSLKNIARNYLLTYFIFDALGTFPWDVFGNRSDDTHSILEILRFFRLVRLVKLFRLVEVFRSRHSLVPLEVRFGLKYGYLRLMTLCVSLMFIAHWVACLFYFFGTVYSSTPSSNRWTQELPPGQYGHYIYSLYFSVYTITTIGYGDVVPGTTLERTYTTIIMFFGAACFAWAISTVSSIFGDLREPWAIYRRNMDALTDFCNVRRLHPGLCFELRRHCQKYYSHRRVEDEQKELLKVLSHDLKLLTLRSIYKEFLIPVLALFEGAKDEDFDSVYLGIEEQFKVAGDKLFDIGDKTDGIYVIKSGVVKLTKDRRLQLERELMASGEHVNRVANCAKKRLDSDDMEQYKEVEPGQEDTTTNSTGTGGAAKPVGKPDTSDEDEQPQSELLLHCGHVFGSDEIVVDQPRSSKAVVDDTAELIFIPKEKLVESLQSNATVWLNLRSEVAKQLWTQSLTAMQQHTMLADASQQLRAFSNAQVGQQHQQQQGDRNGNNNRPPSASRPTDANISGASPGTGSMSEPGASSSGFVLTPAVGGSSLTDQLKMEVQDKAERIKSLEEQLDSLQRQVNAMVAVFQDRS